MTEKIQLPDDQVKAQWGLPEATIDGVQYPEQVMAELDPDWYADNGSPIFGCPECELEPGDEGYDPRIEDGDDMEYLRTVLHVTPDMDVPWIKQKCNHLRAAEIMGFTVSWLTAELGGILHPDVVFRLATTTTAIVEEYQDRNIELPPFCGALSSELIRRARVPGNCWSADGEGFTEWIPIGYPLQLWCPEAPQYVSDLC